jgi:predicted amidohydrolase YtcJ
MIKDWLREFLGINTIQIQINQLHKDIDNFNKNMAINNRNAHLNLMEQIKITQLAHARIIAKIDPAFNKDMASPEARAQSDKIGEEVLKKLISEHKFSNPNGV